MGCTHFLHCGQLLVNARSCVDVFGKPLLLPSPRNAQLCQLVQVGAIMHSLLSGTPVLHAQEPTSRHTAALALAKVAAIELPGQQWPDLVKLLLGNMGVQPPDPGLRQSTLQVGTQRLAASARSCLGH